MVRFHIGNCLTMVENPEPLTQAIMQYLTIKKDGFVKSIDYQEYQNTGKTVLKTVYKPETIYLYNHVRKCFPTGRLGYITDYLWEHNIPFECIDERIKPEPELNVEYIGPPSDGSNGLPPRMYQIEAAGIVVGKGGRGILHHATGSGKTITAARIISTFKVKTLYIVPSLELLYQTAESFTKTLKTEKKIGIIGDGEWDPQDITVSTAASIWSRFETEYCKEFLESIHMIMLDEAHHLSSKEKGRDTKNKNHEVSQFSSWYMIAMNCLNAYYRIGLTGTPGKNIEQKRCVIECATGRVLQHISARSLIDIGVLSDVEIHMHTIKHSRIFPDFPTARKEGVLLNEKFNEYIVQIALSELKMGKSVLILTGSKEHQGPMIQRLFSIYGVDVPFVSGNSGKKDRKNYREDFRSGKQRIIMGTVFGEGVDFPSLDCGILADGLADDKKPVQFLGRVLRTAKGKGIAHLHDFKHLDHKYLQRHSNSRLNEYIAQELSHIITHKGIEV